MSWINENDYSKLMQSVTNQEKSFIVDFNEKADSYFEDDFDENYIMEYMPEGFREMKQLLADYSQINLQAQKVCSILATKGLNSAEEKSDQKIPDFIYVF